MENQKVLPGSNLKNLEQTLPSQLCSGFPDPTPFPTPVNLHSQYVLKT